MTGPGPWVAVLLLLGSCKVSPPGALESAIAGRVKRHLTVGGAADVNPIAASPEEISRGRSASDPIAWSATGSTAMAPGSPSRARCRPRARSRGAGRAGLHRRATPLGHPERAFALRDARLGGILSEPEIWRIVLYVRHLPPAGSLGEPAVYGGDTSSGSAP